jgi:hypothetical protein
VLSVVGLAVILGLALIGGDAAAYGAVAIVVGAYSGANGYIEGHYATRRTAQPEP